MHLLFSVKQGLQEIPEVPELQMSDSGDLDEELKELGYSCYVPMSGHEHATSYAVYVRENAQYKHVITLRSAYYTDSIFCHSTADMIACRAFLSPIVLAESPKIVDLDESIRQCMVITESNEMRLDNDSEIVQFARLLKNI